MKTEYKVKMNMKGICLFEEMTGHSFYKIMDNPEDVIKLMYCCIAANNDEFRYTYEVFVNSITNPKVYRWLLTEYKAISNFISQFNKKEVPEQNSNSKADSPVIEPSITNTVSSLIIMYGLDPHYVMYEMDLWEIEHYLDIAEMDRHRKLEEQRWFTYLSVIPHIDGRKIPFDKYFPFPWEEEDKKKKAEKNLEVNTEAVLRFFNYYDKKTEEDASRKNDLSDGQGKITTDTEQPETT